MRINENSPIYNVADTESAKAKPSPKNESAAPSSEGVTISHAARDLAKASTEAQAEKVEALKRAVESGTYRVEPDKVAGAMIRSMLGDAEEK